MIISILIRSIVKRNKQLLKLLDFLYQQIQDTDSHDKVEILVNLDNKEKTSGRKAQELLEWATGKYVIFIDDDDWVSFWYIHELLKAAESDADCFGICGFHTYRDKEPVKWEISKDHPNENIIRDGKPFYLRRTNHIAAVKREIALAAGFPDKSNAEDKAYSDALVLNTEYKIEMPMYNYIEKHEPKEYL